LHPKITKQEEKKLGAKSCIAFTPINPDGMMILMWTDGMPRKYRSIDQIKAGHDRSVKNIYATPSQYFYIPERDFVALPADIIYAGGFCCGQKMKYHLKQMISLF